MMSALQVLTTATFNLRGLHFKDKKGGAKAKKSANVRALAHAHDVLFLQETNLGPDAGPYLERMVPGYTVFTSASDLRSQGVATILSHSITDHFNVHPLPLPDLLTGRAHALELKSKRAGGEGVTLVNVYLQAGDNFGLKKKQIEALKKSLPRSNRMYVGGDFNFVEDKLRDTSSNSDYYEATAAFLQAWDSFKQALGLNEVVQLSHTRFKTEGGMVVGSSRLDRIYVSFPQADWAVLKPYTYVPFIPNSILNAPPSPSNGNNPTGRLIGISDHVPVALSGSPASLEDDTRGPSIPRWAAQDPDFLRYFEARWLPVAIHLDTSRPFHLIKVMKQCMFGASRDVIRANRERKRAFADAVGELTFLLKALRCRLDPLSPYSISFLSKHDDVGDEASIRRTISGLLDDSMPEEGPSVSPHLSHPDNPTTKLKARLPTTRLRLHALRQELSDIPTTDPDRMAQIACRYWSTIWSPRKEEEISCSPRDYFGDHSLSIPPGLMPELPGVVQIADAINASGNSCAGPDGIPFAAWRAIVKHAAPALHLGLEALAGGTLPPDGFNYGLLFLIPKKGTLLASDTRPISVTNADNRIMAKAVVAAITPALLSTLHHSQKGFVKGRCFEDHIRDLNERFYEVVEGDGDDNLFILFMDTAKAFDSIDHDFIHEAIKRSGLPNWFTAIVHGLLHKVRVKPAFRGARDIWIDIGRGVKQGCPLSPLLFIICYDILLRRVDALEDCFPFACADDLAVASACHLSLWPVMRLVDSFRGASGLGINTGKTRIMMAKDTDISACFRPVTLWDFARKCPWSGVKIADTYRYLGVLFGAKVTTVEVYEEATKALVDRAACYYSSLRPLPHHSRVQVYNTFILTKLSYLIKFFPIPYKDRSTQCTEGLARAQACRLVLPLPAAYNYSFLISPPSRCSPSPPVLDPWAWSTSALVCQNDLGDWDGEGGGDGTVTCDLGDWESMRISRQVRSAGADFVCRVTAYTGLPFDAAVFQAAADATARRRAVYNWLIKTDYEDRQDIDLSSVLSRRGLTHCESLVPVLHTNFSLLPSDFPHHYRCTQFDLITNCLFTSRRFCVLNAKLAGPPPPTDRCFICGLGEDSIRHLFGGECEPVVAARALINGVLQYYGDGKTTFPSLKVGDLKAADYWSSSLLAFPRPGCVLAKRDRKRAVLGMTVFNGVVWYERAYFFRLLSSHPPLPQAVNRIISMVSLEYLRVVQAVPSSGSASAARLARRAIAKEQARRAIAELGPQTLVAFTDGSANPNPGPAGAGVYIYSTNEGSSLRLESYAALGHGTNNLGELWAIGMAAQMALRHLASVPPGTYTHFQVFTDSAFARGCLLGDWKSRKFQRLVTAVSGLKQMISDLVAVDIAWIIAHAGIDGNEHADFLAGLGSERSRAGHVDVDSGRDFEGHNFVPQHHILPFPAPPSP